MPLSRLFPLLCVAVAFGCSDDTTANTDGNETTAASGTDTNPDPDTESSGAMDTTDEPPTTDTNDENTFVSEEGPDTGETGGAGNLGDQCMADGDCAEDLFCNGIAGFGGICSECASDADCEAGNCTLTGMYFGCGDGSLGQNCESDEVCADDLVCAQVANLAGLINDQFCSTCETDADCADGQLCAPQIEFTDITNVKGQRSCIDPNTAANNQICDADGSGDEQCEGFCTTADIMGFIELGVCGACETDADCAMGTCAPAVVGLDGFAGSMCM